MLKRDWIIVISVVVAIAGITAGLDMRKNQAIETHERLVKACIEKTMDDQPELAVDVVLNECFGDMIEPGGAE